MKENNLTPPKETEPADTGAGSTEGVSLSMRTRKPRPMQWMKFDPAIVGTIVEDLTLEGQGAYFKLMRSLWVAGPMSESDVRRKCSKSFEDVRSLMFEVGGGLSFEWLETLRDEADTLSSKRREAAEARYSKSVQVHANAEHLQPIAKQLPSMSKSSSTQEGKERAPEIAWPSWAGAKTLSTWEDFKTYRKAEKKDPIRSTQSEQRAVNLLAKYYTTGQECVEALEECMGRGWLFPVNPAKLNGRNTLPVPAPSPTAKPWVQ